MAGRVPRVQSDTGLDELSGWPSAAEPRGSVDRTDNPMTVEDTVTELRATARRMCAGAQPQKQICELSISVETRAVSNISKSI